VKRSLVGLAVIALALGAAASPAVAATSERYSFDFDFADTIDCSAFNLARTFNDDFEDFFKVRGRVFFDDEAS